MGAPCLDVAGIGTPQDDVTASYFFQPARRFRLVARSKGEPLPIQPGRLRG